MAPVSEVHRRCLTMTLDYLEERRAHMHNAVEDYVNKVISAGKQWAESEDEQKPTFLVMFQKIDSAVEFFCLKYTELSAESGRCSIQTGSDNSPTTQETNVGIAVSNVPSKIPNWCQIQEKRIEDNEDKVKRMTAKIDQIQNLASDLQSLEKQQQYLSKSHDKFQDEISSRITEDLERKFTVLNNETKDFVMSVLNENGSYLDALSRRTDALEKLTTDLSHRMSTNRETLENVLKIEENNETAIKNIQERIVLIDKRDWKSTNDVPKLLGQVQTNARELAEDILQSTHPLPDQNKKPFDSNVMMQSVSDFKTIFSAMNYQSNIDKNKPILDSLPQHESYDDRKEMDIEIAPNKPSSEISLSKFRSGDRELHHYNRAFLLELRNSPLSQKKPEGLPDEEVILDMPIANYTRGTSAAPLDFTPLFSEPYTYRRYASPFDRTERNFMET